MHLKTVEFQSYVEHFSIDLDSEQYLKWARRFNGLMKASKITFVDELEVHKRLQPKISFTINSELDHIFECLEEEHVS